MSADANRRPIAQRSHSWAQWLAHALAVRGAAPNTISCLSVVFAALAGLCFFATSFTDGGARVALCLGAALFCQLRLVANLIDGMVAIEGGKGGPDGPIWNELPDRFADIVILVGAGYAVAAAGLFDASLGWAAAVAAVMTAYVRELARGAGAPPDFSGPMAKPHRMFWMTVAALATIFDSRLFEGVSPSLGWPAQGSGEAGFLALALWIVLLGSVATTLNRTYRALRFLRGGNRPNTTEAAP